MVNFEPNGGLRPTLLYDLFASSARVANLDYSIKQLFHNFTYPEVFVITFSVLDLSNIYSLHQYHSLNINSTKEIINK